MGRPRGADVSQSTVRLKSDNRSADCMRANKLGEDFARSTAAGSIPAGTTR